MSPHNVAGSHYDRHSCFLLSTVSTHVSRLKMSKKTGVSDETTSECDSDDIVQIVDKRGTATSIVWKYYGYGKNDTKQTLPICKLCKKTVPSKTGNTSNLMFHLKSKHPIEHGEANLAKHKQRPTDKSTAHSAQPSQPSTSKQKTIASAFASTSAPYGTQSRRHIEITSAVTNFVVKSMQPLSVVEDKSFQQLLKTVDPRYKIPGRKFFSTVEIPRLYQEKRDLVLSELSRVRFFATTSDLWSSRESTPYISLTVHFINDQWDLKSRCLGAQFIPEDHTGENIATALVAMLEEWSLNQDHQACITTDSGTNMIKAAEINRWTRLQCFGHRLHLAIGELNEFMPSIIIDQK